MPEMKLSYIGVFRSRVKKSTELVLTFHSHFGICAKFPEGLTANEVALKLHEIAQHIEDAAKAQHENPGS